MFDCEIVIQGYAGIQKILFKGYTYLAGGNWYMPKAIIQQVSYGSSEAAVVARTRDSDGKRTLWIGMTGAAWGQYPHISIPRLTIGYGSSASIGNISAQICGASVPDGYTSQSTTIKVLQDIVTGQYLS